MSNIDTLHMQNNMKDDGKPSEQLFKTKRIDGTPFNVLSRDGLYYLTLGNNLLSPPKQSEEEVAQYIIDNSYNIIASLILILIEKTVKTECRQPEYQN